MGLVDIDSIEPLLVCPRCRSAVARQAGGYHCTSTSCLYHEAQSFPLVGGLPVLVDDDKSILSSRLLTRARTAEPPGRQHRLWARAAAGLRSWLGRLVRPVNHVARRNLGNLLQLLDKASPLVLVIGGATEGNGAEALYSDGGVRLVAFDIRPSPLVQFVADAHQIPLDTGTVDAFVVQAVLEHVLEPSRVVEEIHRVLADGGLVYSETPFMQQVHAGAFDFTRFTASGHRYLFRSFDEIGAGTVAGPGTQLLWSVDHVARGVFRSQTAGRVARVLCFWLRFLDSAVPAAYATDDASAFYFLGRKSASKLSPADMVSYYRGAQ